MTLAIALATRSGSVHNKTAGKMIVLLFLAFLQLSMTQQISFGENSDRWWFIAMPARNFSISFPNSNPRDNQSVAKREDYTNQPHLGRYKVHIIALTWNEARLACEQEDAHLAVLTSKEEAYFVAGLLANSQPHIGSNDSDYAFIGFHDLFHEGHYVTIHGQTLAKAGYEVWAAEEPGVLSDEEDCGSIYRDGKLNDIDCDEYYGFICKLNEPSVKVE